MQSGVTCGVAAARNQPVRSVKKFARPIASWLSEQLGWSQSKTVWCWASRKWMGQPRNSSGRAFIVAALATHHPVKPATPHPTALPYGGNCEVPRKKIHTEAHRSHRKDSIHPARPLRGRDRQAEAAGPQGRDPAFRGRPSGARYLGAHLHGADAPRGGGRNDHHRGLSRHPVHRETQKPSTSHCNRTCLGKPDRWSSTGTEPTTTDASLSQGRMRPERVLATTRALIWTWIRQAKPWPGLPPASA